jgi:outer membrane receptor protein involved in Fe transport
MPIDGLRFGLNAAYTEAILTEPVASIGGLSGDTLPYVPRWAGSATADYSFPLQGEWKGRVGGGLRFTGDSETNVTHDPQTLPLASYSVLDLNTDVSNEHWTVRLFVKNVANKVVYTAESPIINDGTGATTQVRGVPLQPRTVGVGFDAKF